MSQSGTMAQKPGTNTRQVQQHGQQQSQQQGQPEGNQKVSKGATDGQQIQQSSSLLQNLALGASAITNCLNHDHNWPELGDVLTRTFEISFSMHYSLILRRRLIGRI